MVYFLETLLEQRLRFDEDLQVILVDTGFILVEPCLLTCFSIWVNLFGQALTLILPPKGSQLKHMLKLCHGLEIQLGCRHGVQVETGQKSAGAEGLGYIEHFCSMNRNIEHVEI